MRALQIASFCFMPFENEPAERSLFSQRPQELEVVLDALLPLHLGALVQSPIEVQVLVGAEVLIQAGVLGEQADHPPDLRAVIRGANLILAHPSLAAGL